MAIITIYQVCGMGADGVTLVILYVNGRCGSSTDDDVTALLYTNIVRSQYPHATLSNYNNNNNNRSRHRPGHLKRN